MAWRPPSRPRWWTKSTPWASLAFRPNWPSSAKSAWPSPRPTHVIVDRISHDIPFYRGYLKNAALSGTYVINNPFWWSADDKFFNYALGQKLGVAVPRTVLIPHKQHPAGTTDRSMRNLQFPMPWDSIFQYVGFPAFLKPFDGGGWKDVYKVNSPEEFFNAYDQSRDLCMTLQTRRELQGIL